MSHYEINILTIDDLKYLFNIIRNLNVSYPVLKCIEQPYKVTLWKKEYDE